VWGGRQPAFAKASAWQPAFAKASERQPAFAKASAWQGGGDGYEGERSIGDGEGNGYEGERSIGDGDGDGNGNGNEGQAGNPPSPRLRRGKRATRLRQGFGVASGQPAFAKASAWQAGNGCEGEVAICFLRGRRFGS